MTPMAEDGCSHSGCSVDKRLSEALGLDVAAVEQQALFRLDLLRMQRGQEGELGYVLIDRKHHSDATVVFASAASAVEALDDHPLIESLLQEDCLDARVADPVRISDIASREIILP